MTLEVKFENLENLKQVLKDEEIVTNVIQTGGSGRFLVFCSVSDKEEMRAFMREIVKLVNGIVTLNVHALIDVLKGDKIWNK